MLGFEREAQDLGIEIKGYHTDNGVYNSKQIMNQIRDNQQILRMCGIGAHHQNGAAENAIKIITRKARIYLLHMLLRWPEHFDKTLWPFAMTHAGYLHNQIPKMNCGSSPVELWKRSKCNHYRLDHSYPFGVPAYVLNAQLQDGHKLPRFNKKKQQGVFVGPSPMHANTVGLIYSPRTHHVSPQFHVIYDDYFETVPNDRDNPPPNWDDIIIQGYLESNIVLPPYSHIEDS